MRTRARWAGRAWIAPPLLLLAVGLHQLWLAHSVGLSAWSGGGFGMFSTTDAGGARQLHAFVLRPGLIREVQLPESVADPAKRARTLPSDANLRAVAHEIADTETPDHGPPTGVRVQVFKRIFDPETLAPSDHIVRSTEIRLGDH